MYDAESELIRTWNAAKNRCSCIASGQVAYMQFASGSLLSGEPGPGQFGMAPSQHWQYYVSGDPPMTSGKVMSWLDVIPGGFSTSPPPKRNPFYPEGRLE